MWLLLYLSLTIHVLYCQGQNGNCELEGIADSDWTFSFINTPVSDTERQLFGSFAGTNVIGVQVQQIGDFFQYFQAEVEPGGVLNIRPTAQFASFERNHQSSPAEPRITVQLIFNCAVGTRNLAFTQPVIDTNTYYPTFNMDSFTYVLPMPFPQNFDVTLFGEAIIVTDYDITNTEIAFAIEPEGDFLVIYDGVMDELAKKHRALITAARRVRFTSPKSYVITATDTGNPARSTNMSLHIEVDVEASTVPSPMFSNAYYVANYIDSGDSHTLDIANAIQLTHGYGANVNIIGEYSDHFILSIANSVVNIELIENLPESVYQEKAFLPLTIEAVVANAEYSGRTALIVALTLAGVDTPATPESTTEINNVTTEASTPENINNVTTEASTPENINNVTTEASTPGSINNETTEASTPGSINNETTEASTPGSINNETTEASTPGSIRFVQDVFTFLLSPIHTIDERLLAIADPEQTIAYDLDSTTGTLPDVLVFDRTTAHLTNIGYLSNGVHNLTVSATGQTSGYVITAPVIIVVGSIQVCNNEVVATYSVFIARVKENINATILVKDPTEENAEYRYYIEDQSPSTSNEIIFVNSTTGDLQCNEIDREWEGFSNAASAQFVLTLRLRRSIPESTYSIRSAFKSDNTLLPTSNTIDTQYMQCPHINNTIFNEPDKTIVVVIIEDVNDNKPTFDRKEIFVGYPRENLAAVIAPPYIVQVKAIDADIGYNAAIQYSANDNRVIIHPTTGIIYPSELMFTQHDDFTFDVVAQDQNGNGLISENNLTVQLKLLDQEHISVLTLRNVLLENLDVLLSDLKASANIEVRSLTASVLARGSTSELMRNSAADSFLTITAYAFDEQNDLVTTVQLQQILYNVNELTVQSFLEPAVVSVIEETLKGWIAIVVVLCLLLCITIGGFLAFYHFKYRRVNSQTRDTEIETQVPVFQENAKLQTTGNNGVNLNERRPTAFEFSSPIYDAEVDEYGENIQHTETTPKQRREIATQNSLELENSVEKAKSVKFNEEVEQIHIETQVDELEPASVRTREDVENKSSEKTDRDEESQA